MAGSKLGRVLSEPGKAIEIALALLKGQFYKTYLPLTGRRFRAGRGLRVYGRIKMKGSGQVIFGDNVLVWGTITPWTYKPDAVIEVGDESWLTGTRFGCHQRISIGREGMLSTCHIFDSDFHSIQANRRDPSAPIRVAPVEIDDNVWIGSDAAVLPGARIGKNSVVSVLTVCAGKYPDDVVIAGHPGRAVAKVPGPDGVVPPSPTAARPAAPAPVAG